tara:strand:+ start:1778 stop:2071 length:294 start_codon:yes stop_codon:yes gene_type:complete
MSEVGQESGAITYVAITVVVFVFIAMCVVWFITKNNNPYYTSVGKTSNEDLELVPENSFTIDSESSEEEIELYNEDDTTPLQEQPTSLKEPTQLDAV